MAVSALSLAGGAVESALSWPAPAVRCAGIQGAEDQGQHAQVWTHLPLLLHRARQAEEQGPHLALPGQQVLHRIQARRCNSTLHVRLALESSSCMLHVL